MPKQPNNHYFYDPALFPPGTELPRDVVRVEVPGFTGALYADADLAKGIEKLKSEGKAREARGLALWFGAKDYGTPTLSVVD